MVDDAGHTWTDTLEEGSNREVQLRIDSIVTTFYHAEFRPDLRRSFTASWAATMFGRHPDAKRVIARVDVYDLPTMDQYRRGLDRAGATSTRPSSPGGRGNHDDDDQQ